MGQVGAMDTLDETKIARSNSSHHLADKRVTDPWLCQLRTKTTIHPQIVAIMKMTMIYLDHLHPYQANEQIQYSNYRIDKNYEPRNFQIYDTSLKSDENKPIR